MGKIKSLTVNDDGMDRLDAEMLWDQVAGYASYSFNKSHAAEYSLISYQAMYLKTHYPVEFYAAALSTSAENKLQLIVNDAFRRGIRVIPPDINISTDEFLIGNDTLLFMPFNAIKGVSDKGAREIMKARNKKSITVTETTGRGDSKVAESKTVAVTKGKFASIADLEARAEKRLVNSRVVESLNEVGAFARIEPGQRPALDATRRKAQMVLLPGLMTGIIEADREIPLDKYVLARVAEIISEYSALKDADDMTVNHTRVLLPKQPKFMVVTDCPTKQEEGRKFTEGTSFAHTAQALAAVGLNRSDAYWTALVKKRPAGKTISSGEIKTYAPFLQREVELLKPPLIVTLGSNASRWFVPELKGNIMDHAGRTFYDEKLDAMIIIGFNAQQIYFDPSRADILVDIMETARSVIRGK